MGKASRRKQVLPAPSAAAPAGRVASRPLARVAGRWRPGWLLGPLAVVALGAALYANSFAIPFLFDDHFEIVGNPAVVEPAPLASYLGRSRGLTLYTFALDARRGGMDPRGFHAVNVAIHLINALLVWALVWRTLTLPALAARHAAAAPLLAALTAAVFVAHPLQTMAASYIVQRAESLAALWYLTAMLAVAAAVASDGRRRLACVAVAAVAAALGVASKEVAATLPAAALAFVWCFAPASSAAGGRRRWLLPLVLVPPLLYALWLALPYLLPSSTDPFNPDAPRAWIFVPSAGFQMAGADAWHYLLTQPGVILWYLRLYLLPTAQTFDYGWPIADSLWRADVLLPGALLLAAVAAALACRRRYPLATFCIAWVFITLAPASSIVPLRDAAFEHRMYLPLVGLAWLTVVGGADALAWLAARLGRSRRALEQAGIVALALWIALLGALTLRRNEVLADPLALARDSIAGAPHHWRPYFELGSGLAAQGRSEEAIAALREAVRLDPEQGAPRVQLAGLLLRTGELDEAEAVARPATERSEESIVAAAYQVLAHVSERRGDPLAAADLLHQAARAKPEWASLRRHRARLLARDGTWYPAALDYNRAIALKPSLLPRLRADAVRANLKAAEAMRARDLPRGAIRFAEIALSYEPGSRAARWQLAAAASAAGEWARAEAELQALQAAAPHDTAVDGALIQVRARQPVDPPPLR